MSAPAPAPNSPAASGHRLAHPQAANDLLMYRLNRLIAVAGSLVVRLCEGGYGITRREWGLLMMLAQHPGMPPAELAQRLGLDRARTSRAITRSRTSWALACFFGLQATAAYITMGWIPQIFRDAGVSAGTAGVLLAVIMAMGVPLAFVIPRVAARLRTQGPIVLVLGGCGLLGYAGLYLAPAGGSWLWALLLGIANCAFPLALTMIGMRARSGAGVVRLSAFAQSTGYLLSIPGPLLVGVLYQHSGGWGLPLALMAGLLVPQTVAGVLAGRNRVIEDEC